MAVRLEVEDSTVDVRFTGWDRFWTLHRGPRIPREHVVGARVGDRKTEMRTLGFRLAGSYVPGRLTAGLFRTRGGGRQLWAVHRGPEVLVIDLRDERWDRLVLEVDDPAAAAARVTALPAPDSSSGRSGRVLPR